MDGFRLGKLKRKIIFAKIQKLGCAFRFSFQRIVFILAAYGFGVFSFYAKRLVFAAVISAKFAFRIYINAENAFFSVFEKSEYKNPPCCMFAINSIITPYEKFCKYLSSFKLKCYNNHMIFTI